MLREGPEGFKGGLSAESYRDNHWSIPRYRDTRSGGSGCERGALLRVGERRHARYHIAIPMQKVSPVILDEDGNLG